MSWNTLLFGAFVIMSSVQQHSHASSNAPQPKCVGKRCVGSEELVGGLHLAAYQGDVSAVVQLLDRGVDVNSRARGLDGSDVNFTPLIAASENGHLEVAEALIARGADVNARSTDGQTALHASAFNQHPKTVELLARSGTAIEVRELAS